MIVAKYRAELAALASRTGGRNAQLLGLASLGIMAGIHPDNLVEDILDAGGEPRLSRAEVLRAVRRAERDTVPMDGKHHPRPRPPRPRPSPRLQKGCVRRLIEKGGGLASFEDLRELSPRRPWENGEDTRREQAIATLCALHGPREELFLGQKTDREVKPRSAWEDALLSMDPARWPPLFMPNPLTGAEGLTGDGKPSRRCKACVASRRYALIEFDGMPLDRQCAFWRGLIRSETLAVASLVYSGGKSIHGLLRIAAETPEGWRSAWDRLEALFCSPADPPEERADRACRDESRTTRLPGATRAETGREQSLLYLADCMEGISPAAWQARQNR